MVSPQLLLSLMHPAGPFLHAATPSLHHPLNQEQYQPPPPIFFIHLSPSALNFFNQVLHVARSACPVELRHRLRHHKLGRTT